MALDVVIYGLVLFSAILNIFEIYFLTNIYEKIKCRRKKKKYYAKKCK